MKKQERTHIKSRKSIDRDEFIEIYNSGIPIKDIATYFGISHDTINRLRDDYGLPKNEEGGTLRIRKCCPACGSPKIYKYKKVKGKVGMYRCEACDHEFRSPATKQMNVKRFALPKTLATVIDKQMHEAV